MATPSWVASRRPSLAMRFAAGPDGADTLPAVGRGPQGEALVAVKVPSNLQSAISNLQFPTLPFHGYNAFVEPYADKMRRGGTAAIQEVAAFFMKTDPVHQSLREISHRLDSLGIPYAVAGGMALVAHGYDRTTVDIDVLVTPDGLKAAQASLTGLGYTPPFAGSKNLRDAQTGVQIEFLVSGSFPGDGKPKPVSFPDPAAVAVEIDGIRYVGLATLIELKLASGMTNPGRLRDLADVQELIRVLRLPAEYASQLNPYVREKYAELHTGLQNA